MRNVRSNRVNERHLLDSRPSLLHPFSYNVYSPPASFPEWGMWRWRSFHFSFSTIKPMNDQDYYTQLDSIFDEIMSQAGKLVFQNYGHLNDVLMETTRRLQKAHEIEVVYKPQPSNP